MAEEFEVMTLTDENGEDVDFDLVDAFDYEGKKYCILFPTGMTDEERMADDPVILEYVSDGTEDYLQELEDDEEYSKIYQLYLDDAI